MNRGSAQAAGMTEVETLTQLATFKFYEDSVMVEDHVSHALLCHTDREI